jgi:hypothetical protein
VSSVYRHDVTDVIHSDSPLCCVTGVALLMPVHDYVRIVGYVSCPICQCQNISVPGKPVSVYSYAGNI